MNIRIIIADDHKIVREGLRSLIDKQTRMEVVAEADDGRKTVQLARELKPDVIVMDISMPDLNGIEATKQIVSENSLVNIIGLSMHSDRRFVSRMLKAGASGYLLKDCAFDELATAINTVFNNKIYLSPVINDIVVNDYLKGGSTAEFSKLSLLSQREREILQLIVEGVSTKQIATNLHVSVKTIETHRQNLINKLDIRNLADLTKFAIREGLTSV